MVDQGNLILYISSAIVAITNPFIYKSKAPDSEPYFPFSPLGLERTSLFECVAAIEW